MEDYGPGLCRKGCYQLSVIDLLGYLDKSLTNNGCLLILMHILDCMQLGMGPKYI